MLRGSGRCVSRRLFIGAGGLGGLGLSLSGANNVFAARSAAETERAVIWLMLVGGPSQLESFDPKPDAPAEVRGPFGSIATSVPGVRVNEFLPKLAQRLNHVALVRSLHHDAAPIHETGLQLLQTGRLCRLGQEFPHFGAVAARTLDGRAGAPPFVILPGRIRHTGVNVSHGDSPDLPGPDAEVASLDSARLRQALDLTGESRAVREAYGDSSFGRDCLRARRLVEGGSKVVTVNMYRDVFREVSWDAHGGGPFSTLEDYRCSVLPSFDNAYGALLDDLKRSGRLATTLVVATGEFGRTPRLNPAGGRDHWPGVWTALLAGGGVRGGQVIGASDSHASEPTDRPVSPAELPATVYRSLRIDPASIRRAADGSTGSALTAAGALEEAFA